MIPERCTSCGLESGGKEVCTICAHPRPGQDPRAFKVRIDHPGVYLVTLLDPYHIEVARQKDSTRWHAPLPVERVA